MRRIAAAFALFFLLMPPMALAQGAPPVANQISDVGNTAATDNTTVIDNSTANATDPASNSTVPAKSKAGASNDKPGEPISTSGTTLVKLFVLAVILESALALLFNWRPFVATFDGRSLKTVISLIGAVLIVFLFEPDALKPLIESYRAPPAANQVLGDGAIFLVHVLEAMVIAGGSAGVYRLLVALGVRSPRSEEVTPKPDYTEAWIAVALRGKGAIFPAAIMLDNGTAKLEIGTLYEYARPRSFWSYFRKDRGRFPQSGGYSVTPEKPFTLSIVDSAGTASAPSRQINPAKGAIIDVEITLL